MLRDVGYARISNDDTRRGLGVARQSEDIRYLSESSGGTLVDILLGDNDISASRFATKRRKDFPRLLTMMRAGQVDRVIVWNLDRLLRIPGELEEMIKIVEQRPGLVVVDSAGRLDLNTADGRKRARDKVADAAYESDRTSERLKRAYDQMALMGKRHGARAFGYACANRRPASACPDGCTHDDHTVCEIDGCPHDGVSIIPAEAKLLRQAAAEVLAGEGLNGIATRWNAMGVPPPQHGQRWTTR